MNAAKTPDEALRHIRAMRPFFELPDLVLAPTEKFEGVQLAATNAGARMEFAGAEVPLTASPDEGLPGTPKGSVLFE